MPSARTVLITGAAGFIGSHLTRTLLARGDRVIGLDNFDTFYDPAIKHARVEQLQLLGGDFEIIEGDIRDAETVKQTYARAIDATIHLAARAGVRPSIADPALYASVNVVGTTVLLEAAKDAHPSGPFLLASSSSVYGNNEKIPFAESDDVEAPISPYAATKRSCELLARTYHELFGMPIACLRYFTVFGPGQRPDLAIAKFIRLIDAGEPIPMFGDGSTSRDYTYIDDITTGVLSALDRIGSHGYRIWNLGSDRPVPLRDMIATIGRIVGKDPVIDQRPIPPGDVDRTFADLTLARAELGYEPRTPFEEGVRKQFEAWQAAQT
ncbi:MAG: SDR family NAD(P)-dependent oxidoreductase [Planctomycetota bacterium]